MDKDKQLFYISLGAFILSFLNAWAFMINSRSMHESLMDAVMAYLAVILLLVFTGFNIFAYYYKDLVKGKKRRFISVFFYLQLLIFALMLSTFIFVFQGGAEL